MRTGDQRRQGEAEEAADDAALRSRDRLSDLLEGCFDAPAPNRRWVADITYVMMIAGWAYTRICDGLVRRRILGWQVADYLRSDLALDGLEMAIWARRHESTDGLVHHSDRGIPRSATRGGSPRLRRSGRSGARGDSYDNAAAEALNSLYKRELIDLRKDWQDTNDVMIATMDWVQWYNDIRLHSYCGGTPPREYEESYSKALASGKLRTVRGHSSLQTRRGEPP